MDKEILFLTVIALFSLGFCLVNTVSYLRNKERSKETLGTVVSFRTVNPPTERMRNSKWAVVRYKAGNKYHISRKHIQVPMWADVGSFVPIRYDAANPEKIYCFSRKRIAVSALLVLVCILAVGYKLL